MNVKALVFVGGNQTDHYVIAQKSWEYFIGQRNRSVPIQGLRFPQGYHDLLHEPNGMGQRVYDDILKFIN